MDLQIFKFQWKTKGFLLSLFGTIKFQVLLYFEPEGAYDDESNQSMMAHGRTYFKFYATTNGSYLIEYFGFKWSLFKNEKWDWKFQYLALMSHLRHPCLLMASVHLLEWVALKRNFDGILIKKKIAWPTNINRLPPRWAQ